MNLPIGNRRLYAPHVEPSDDPRFALGACTRQAHWPDSLCEHCFRLSGALIQATSTDANGRGTCALCSVNPNRWLS